MRSVRAVTQGSPFAEMDARAVHRRMQYTCTSDSGLNRDIDRRFTAFLPILT